MENTLNFYYMSYDPINSIYHHFILKCLESLVNLINFLLDPIKKGSLDAV